MTTTAKQTTTTAAAAAAAAAKPAAAFTAKEKKAIAAVAASATSTDSAKRQAVSSYGDLLRDVKALIGKAGDGETARLLGGAYAALIPDTTMGSASERGAIWKRRAQCLNVTVRRFIDGKAGEAPRFNLFYCGLDAKTMTARVVCLKAPTAKEIKLALASDVKACNAHIERLFPTKAVKLPTKAEPAPAPQTAMPGKVNKGDAMGSLRELVAGWRPGELEAAAAFLLESATAARAAIAKAKADKEAAAKAKKSA